MLLQLKRDWTTDPTQLADGSGHVFRFKRETRKLVDFSAAVWCANAMEPPASPTRGPDQENSVGELDDWRDYQREASPGSINEYSFQRWLNIRRNKERLRSLGFPSPVVVSKQTPARRVRTVKHTATQPRRCSTRLSSHPKVEYSERSPTRRQTRSPATMAQATPSPKSKWTKWLGTHTVTKALGSEKLKGLAGHLAALDISPNSFQKLNRQSSEKLLAKVEHQAPLLS